MINVERTYHKLSGKHWEAKHIEKQMGELGDDVDESHFKFQNWEGVVLQRKREMQERCINTHPTSL